MKPTISETPLRTKRSPILPLRTKTSLWQFEFLWEMKLHRRTIDCCLITCKVTHYSRNTHACGNDPEYVRIYILSFKRLVSSLKAVAILVWKYWSGNWPTCRTYSDIPVQKKMLSTMIIKIAYSNYPASNGLAERVVQTVYEELIRMTVLTTVTNNLFQNRLILTQ